MLENLSDDVPTAIHACFIDNSGRQSDKITLVHAANHRNLKTSGQCRIFTKMQGGIARIFGHFL